MVYSESISEPSPTECILKSTTSPSGSTIKLIFLIIVVLAIFHPFDTKETFHPGFSSQWDSESITTKLDTQGQVDTIQTREGETFTVPVEKVHQSFDLGPEEEEYATAFFFFGSLRQFALHSKASRDPSRR